MKPIGNTFALLAIIVAGHTTAQAEDPLPSWNDGAAKKSITEFVAKVTKEASSDFVPIAERIATFDNDGTLWCEQPMYFQLLFALDRIKALAPQHPEWKTSEPFASLLKGDVKFTNFESTIFDARKGQSPNEGRFLSAPEVLDALKTFGFNLLSLANNHSFDMKVPGIVNTLEQAKRLNLGYAGIGMGISEAVAPGYLDYGHTPPGRGPGGARDDYQNAVKQAGAVIGYTIDALVADAEMVAAAWTGTLPGGAEIGKGLSLYRTSGGLLRSTRHALIGTTPS